MLFEISFLVILINLKDYKQNKQFEQRNKLKLKDKGSTNEAYFSIKYNENNLWGDFEF